MLLPGDLGADLLAVLAGVLLDQIQRGVELPLVWGGVPLTNATASNGVVTSGAFNGVKGVVRNDGNNRDATIKSLGWNNQFKAGDGWTLTSDLSWSKVDRTDMIK